jgi:hypothetical protein
MKLVNCSWLGLVFCVATAGSAGAQAAVTAASTAAAPSTAAPEATPVAAEAPAPASEPSPTSSVLMPQAASACFPGCRKGFVCRAGECVSQCNPPCAAGERCTEQLECIAPQPVVPEPGPGAETHDGFYLHLSIGVGGGGAERQTTGGKVRWEGGTGLFSVDVGGTPVENLVVFGRISSFTLSEPRVEIDRARVASSDDDALSFGMLGAGVAYYFMPLNLFVGGAVGLASASTADEDDDDSKVGFGLNLDVGKEWWVGEQWALGVALRLAAANVPPADSWGASDKHLQAGSLGVLFSATYH